MVRGVKILQALFLVFYSFIAVVQEKIEGIYSRVDSVINTLGLMRLQSTAVYGETIFWKIK